MLSNKNCIEYVWKTWTVSKVLKSAKNLSPLLLLIMVTSLFYISVQNVQLKSKANRIQTTAEAE